MFLPEGAKLRSRSGLSLTELLVVVAAIGIIAAIALPSVSNIRDSAIKAAAVQNAKNISSMSEALASLGVAHVIPDSMGGVEATGRLLREGVIVPEGPMAGEKFILSGMTDDDVEEAAKYLTIEYDEFNLRLHYMEPVENTGLLSISADLMLCMIENSTTRVLLGVLAK